MSETIRAAGAATRDKVKSVWSREGMRVFTGLPVFVAAQVGLWEWLGRLNKETPKPKVPYEESSLWITGGLSGGAALLGATIVNEIDTAREHPWKTRGIIAAGATAIGGVLGVLSERHFGHNPLPDDFMNTTMGEIVGVAAPAAAGGLIGSIAVVGEPRP